MSFCSICAVLCVDLSKVCGVDLRDASHEQAVEAIRRAGDCVLFLVQSGQHRSQVLHLRKTTQKKCISAGLEYTVQCTFRYAYITLCSIWVPRGSGFFPTINAKKRCSVYSVPLEVSAMLCVGVCSIMMSSGHKPYWTALSLTENISSVYTYHIGRIIWSSCIMFQRRIEIHLPIFRPQSPMLTNHERLTPTPQSNSHSSKVTLVYYCRYFQLHTALFSFKGTVQTKGSR